MAGFTLSERTPSTAICVGAVRPGCSYRGCGRGGGRRGILRLRCAPLRMRLPLLPPRREYAPKSWIRSRPSVPISLRRMEAAERRFGMQGGRSRAGQRFQGQRVDDKEDRAIARSEEDERMKAQIKPGSLLFHLLQNAVEEFEQDFLDRLSIRGD